VVDVADRSTEHLTGSGTGTVNWSPDGSVLAIFDSGDIVVMKADGTDRIRIAQTDVLETSPMWQPSG
jgi:Tol biopolymer transport system component